MQNRWKLWLVALAIVLVPRLSTTAPQVQTVIPFTLKAGHLIVVGGSIGSGRNLGVVIDAGASTCVITSPLAKALGLKGRAKQAAAFDKTIEVPEVTVQALAIGALRFEEVPARVGPLEFPDLTEPVRIDVLIGLNLLRKIGLVIDYRARILTFGPVIHAGCPVPFYNKLPVVPVTVWVGDRTVNLLLDTGFGALVLFSRGLEGRVAFRRSGEISEIRSAGGKRRLEQILLANVRLGETEWETVTAYVLDGVSPISRLDGILGVAALGLKRLCLDFEKGLMSWER